jgi:hypothetical protein
MSRGGDRHPIDRVLDRQGELGTLLLDAMVRDPSSAGRRFRGELKAFYKRHRRLVRVLARRTGTGLPAGGSLDAERLEQFLEIALVRPLVWYPRPRRLTESEQAEYEWRHQVVQAIIDDRFLDLNPRFDQSDSAADAEWKGLCDSLYGWRDEVLRQANPSCKLRKSQRQGIRHFIAEAEQFCERWRLRAPWVRSLIIVGAFRSLKPDSLEPDLDRSFGFSVSQAAKNITYPITVRLSGRSEAAYTTDRPLSEVMLQTVLDADTAHPVTVVRRPTRAEMHELETGGNAAVVTVDWDGRRWYPSPVDPDRVLDIGEFIIEACELRMGKGLTVRERRRIRSDIEPQLQAARAALPGPFEVTGSGDFERHARWVARRLLDLKVTYQHIAIAEQEAGYQTLDKMTVRSACVRYAERAGLHLP